MEKRLQKGVFTELCRSHGLKVTPQRRAIYRALLNSREHPSAEDIYRSLLDDFPSLSFDTVYRTLNTFAEIGVTRVIEGYGKTRRFDPDLETHHHLHCIKCGSIIDFQDEAYDRLDVPEHVSDRFDVISKRVVLTGICEKCREES